jgi:hypothetical protein
MQAYGGIRRQHAVGDTDEQRIAEAVAQPPQRMADRRLGEPETFAGRGEAAQIPDREKTRSRLRSRCSFARLMEAIISMNLTNYNRTDIVSAMELHFHHWSMVKEIRE